MLLLMQAAIRCARGHVRVGSQVRERLPMLAQKSNWKFQVSGCRIDEARYADSTLMGSFSNASTYLDIGVSNKLKKFRAFGASFASKFLPKFSHSSFWKDMLKLGGQ
jgi:hypothetical protein